MMGMGHDRQLPTKNQKCYMENDPRKETNHSKRWRVATEKQNITNKAF
jgi:hypothetical protein